ncbi:REP element-mobilizing transposase RayT [Flavobacterium arsenatis]|uniref:REP element-mobilizing transposase RayT n=1 Tax=Flavobacterium arsenatis TaxID=1484332 RepID=A0ABU1TK06_9FLAO|nr:IS200/IS605 family transposase [Flavobacterium arsenatis]MDR6966317.1 REP element-mobilizing transposase RayT [Flavobacterium arsenatis]
MPQSLSYNYIHLVFSTKNREHSIHPDIEQKLYEYMGGICKNLESTAIQIGGHTDHIHILFLLSKKITLIKFVEEVKKSSSKWIKTQGSQYANFYWQGGYGAFSVNPKQIEIVKQYILNQKEHHSKKTFQQEYLKFLKDYDVDYDERYVWD